MYFSFQWSAKPDIHGHLLKLPSRWVADFESLCNFTSYFNCSFLSPLCFSGIALIWWYIRFIMPNAGLQNGRTWYKTDNVTKGNNTYWPLALKKKKSQFHSPRSCFATLYVVAFTEIESLSKQMNTDPLFPHAFVSRAFENIRQQSMMFIL